MSTFFLRRGGGDVIADAC